MTRRLVLALTVATLAHASAASAPFAPRVVIDGSFEDWNRVQVAAHDPADAPASYVDLRDVQVTADERYLYASLMLARTVTLQSLPGGIVSFLIDQDADAKTGQTVKGQPGIDLSVEIGAGVAVRRFTGGAAAPVDVELDKTATLFAPRYASERFEFRFERASAKAATMKILYEQGGTVRDEIDPISVSLPDAIPAQEPGPDERIPQLDPLSRSKETDLRVVTWNVAGLRKIDRGSYMRILAAIDADVVLLDEADPRRPAGDLAEWLNSANSAERPSWQSILGRSFQGTWVAVRGQATQAFEYADYPQGFVEALGALQPPDFAQRRAQLSEIHVGTTGVIASVRGRRILSVPVDMTSGGAHDTYNDALRTMEATAIAQAARAATRSLKPDAIIIGGDFNLVGSRDPVDLLVRSQLDVDGSSLGETRSLTLDGESNATWRGLGGGRFTAGRLDWMLFSDSSLAQTGGFVFDTAAISPYWLKQHHLLPEDSTASDHLPLVADFRWKK